MKGDCVKRIAAIFLLLMIPVLIPAAPVDPSLKVGILAYRPKPDVMEQWEPVVSYLQSALGKPVELAVYDHSELYAAAARHAVDVVITTANHFILLQHTVGLSSPLATLVTRDGTNRLSAYGGAIFACSNRADITSIRDLAGKRIAVVSTDAFGGYQMQALELVEMGLPVPAASQLLLTGQPHDRVIETVLAGRADAGFVRAGVLETLVQEGKLDSARVKIINRQDLPAFPFAVSTRLYPEWPVAVMPQIDKRLASRLAAVLFLLPPDRFAGTAGGVSGFTIPANYRGVENLMRRLRLPPFDRVPEISLADIYRRYAVWIAALAGLLLLLSMAIIGLVKLNRRSQQLLRERKRVEVALQESETKHRIVADNTYDWEFWQGADGQFLYTSPSCKRITGRDLRDFLADATLFRRIVHADDQERYDRHVSDFHQRQGPGEMEYRLVRPDGAIRWIHHVCQPIFDEAGAYIGRRGSNRDITERKRAEEALLKLNQELERRVKERTAALEAKNGELEQLIKAFVGREMRMVELKEKMRGLEKKMTTDRNE